MNIDMLGWKQFVRVLIVLCLVIAERVRGAETTDYVVQVTASVSAAPPSITLLWPEGSALSYVVSRKFRDSTNWSAGVNLEGTAAGYTDTNVSVGIPYEYEVKGGTLDRSAFGYIYAGIEVPAIENRGKIILLVDATHASDLSSELERLAMDLVGDGWRVIRHTVSRSSSVTEIKALIIADYLADPENVKSVFLIGHVPVPYSGVIAPDGHSPDHYGAWPTDVFYADMNGVWTDTTANVTDVKQNRNQNIPGDGKFDQKKTDSVELEIGRLDLSNLPAFTLSETELIRRYLDKDHTFRHKITVVERRALIADNFGSFYGEAFAASGWRNFSPLVGKQNIISVESGEFLTAFSGHSYLLAYGCGPGTYTSVAGIGTTRDVASSNIQAVFTMLFGSYFGDWDSEDNIMRSLIAASGTSLTSSWAGRPHWFYHHMALGEPVGFSALVTQNNKELYKKQNFGTAGVHIALMGDPSLRLHPVSPPENFEVKGLNAGIGVSMFAVLEWSPSKEAVLGYNIYRASSLKGSFDRLNKAIVIGTNFVDATVSAGLYVYQVRALKLEVSPSGSYYNLSQGVFASIDVTQKGVVPLIEIQIQKAPPAPKNLVLTKGPGLIGKGMVIEVPKKTP